MQSAIDRATAAFRKAGGTLRTARAIRVGIHPRTLYAMRDAGLVESLGRDLYRLAELPALGNPDLATVALRVPRGVVCLISALAFHEVTTQIPHVVDLALPRDVRKPRIEHPPVRVFRFAGPAMRAGVETREVDGVRIRVFGVEKTLADCFKYRNKLGLDTAIEALRLCRQRRRINIEKLMEFTAINRVRNVMRPYLEAVL